MMINDETNISFDSDYFKTGSARIKSSSAVAVPSDEGEKIEFGVVIQASCERLYELLSDLQIYKVIIPNLISVIDLQPGRSHWSLKGSGDKPIVFDVELITQKQNQVLAWRTNDPSDIASAGSLRLKKLPFDRGTELKLAIKYDVPNENLKTAFQKLFGESAEDEVRTSVRRFKALVETGEIPSTEGQPRGGYPEGASDPQNSYKIQDATETGGVH